MTRYWRVFRIFVSSSIARELEFKANFVAKMLGQLVWMAFFAMMLLVVYRTTDNVAGWSRGAAMILASTVFLMKALAGMLFSSLHEIPTQVRMGTLDFVITKPIDSQFWNSTRRFNFDPAATFVAGFAFLLVGIQQGGRIPAYADWLGFAALLLAALGLFYSLSLAMMATGIWFVRVENLWVLTETLTDVVRFPIDIYTGWVRSFITYVLPLAFLATMPARQLAFGVDLPAVALGLLYAGVALAGARGFWQFALRHYGSASS